jgi:hypothetical protein
MMITYELDPTRVSICQTELHVVYTHLGALSAICRWRASIKSNYKFVMSFVVTEQSVVTTCWWSLWSLAIEAPNSILDNEFVTSFVDRAICWGSASRVLMRDKTSTVPFGTFSFVSDCPVRGSTTRKVTIISSNGELDVELLSGSSSRSKQALIKHLQSDPVCWGGNRMMVS